MANYLRNVTSSSTVVAALEAARDNNAPIILQMSQGGAAYFAGKVRNHKSLKQIRDSHTYTTRVLPTASRRPLLLVVLLVPTTSEPLPPHTAFPLSFTPITAPRSSFRGWMDYLMLMKHTSRSTANLFSRPI